MNQPTAPPFNPHHSLKITLLLPLMVFGAMGGIGGGWLVHDAMNQELRTQVLSQAKLLTNAINYAAETVSEPTQLQRQVTAIGGERDVDLILVVAGQPARIIASTYRPWLGLTLDALPARRSATELEDALNNRQSLSEFHNETLKLHIIRPLELNDSGSSTGRLNRGAALIYVDTRSMQRTLSRADALLGVWLVMVLASVGGLAYWLVRRRILHPAHRIAETIRQRASGDSSARTNIVTEDEIGVLAQTLDNLLDTQIQAERDLANFYVALRESEAQFRALFHNAGMGIALVDMDGHPVHSNPALQVMLGYSDDELREMAFTEFTHPDDAAKDMNLYRELIAGRRDVYRIEKRYYRKDGQLIYADLTVTLIRNPEGIPQFGIGIVEDITERKAAEDALRTSQTELKERNEILAALNTVADRVYRSLDLHAVAQEAVEAIMRYTGSPSVAFFLLNETEPGLNLIYGKGFSEKALSMASSLPLEGSLSGITVDRGNVVTSVDIATDDRVEPATRDALIAQGLNAVASVPLLFSNRVLGVINLIFENTRNFSELERETLLALGKTIGLAVANAIHVKQIEDEVEERKRTANELQQEREFLKAILDNIQDGIVACNAEGTLTLFNQATEKFHGLPQKPLPPEKWTEHYDLYMPDGATPMRREDIPLFRALNGETVRDVEMVIAPNRGKPRTLIANGQAFYDQNGMALGAVVSMNDITEQKRAEHALRESEERYRRIVETAEEGIWVIDADNNTSFVNRKMMDMLGYTEQEMLGKRLDMFMDIEGQAIASGYLERRRAGISEQHDFKFKRKDGTDLWALIGTNPILDDEGRYMGALAMITDITSRRQAEEEIRKLNEDLEERVRRRTAELEASNRELESFSYSVSHDLRAPLRGIDGWSLALLEDYGKTLDPTAREYLDRVRSEAQRMGELIDDLLTLARVMRSEMQWDQIDLSGIAENQARAMQELEPDRKVKWRIQQGITSQGDPRLLGLVLQNLIGNAWKFTSRHDTAWVEFGITERDDRRVFFIRDDGAGFDMTYAEKLFTPFQRLHRPVDFPGTGVGLAITQRIIQRHGGRIWAEAAVEQGATFYFTLEAP